MSHTKPRRARRGEGMKSEGNKNEVQLGNEGTEEKKKKTPATRSVFGAVKKWSATHPNPVAFNRGNFRKAV